MASRGHLRASDGDREQVAERLRHAAAEGRLSTAELEHRMTSALSARTYAQLDALVADLPGKSLARGQRQRSELVTIVRPALAIAIAIPVAMAAIAAVVFVVTGAFALWLVWVALGWWFVGRHNHRRAVQRRPRPAGPYRAAPSRRGGFRL